MSAPSEQPELKLDTAFSDKDTMEVSTVANGASKGAIPAIAIDSPHTFENGNRSNTSPVDDPVKPTIFRRAWTKLGINPTVAMIMIKPAIAAVISLAICQRHSVAVNFLNFGYLIIIVSITTVPILPRGKFLLNLALSLQLTCFAAAMVLLGQWAAIKAREHSTPAGATLAVAHGYNSSASVINALFLMFNIFAINVLRASRPAFSIAAIQYTLFVMVGFVYGPMQPTTAYSKKFVKELLYTFLAGQGISTGVALFIIPISSRKVFFSEARDFLQGCRRQLQTQAEVVSILEQSLYRPILSAQPSIRGSSTRNRSARVSVETTRTGTVYNERSASLKVAASEMISLGAKLQEDVVFAKREIAFGHFRATDIQEFFHLLKNIMIPMSGLSTLGKITQRLQNENSEYYASPEFILTTAAKGFLRDDQKDWLEMLRALSHSFDTVVQVLDETLLHILLLLKLIPTPKKANSKANGKSFSEDEDIEKGSESPRPGEIGYGDHLEKLMHEFREKRSTELQKWAEERGLSAIFRKTQKEAMNPPELKPHNHESDAFAREVLMSERLHIVLYMEYLLYSVAKAMLATVRFAERKMEDGTLNRQRLVVPALKTIKKLARGLISGKESSPDLENLEQSAPNAETVYLGDSLQRPRDPEHLPPKNFVQRWNNNLRLVPKFFSSAPVKFGFRVTIGTMSVGILAYLAQTHVFFIKQRVVWSLIMISIGMSPTAGNAVFNLGGNLAFTLAGMIGAFINWYAVDQTTIGVVIFFPFCLMFYFYFAAKHFRYLIPIVAGALTHVLVIGYLLQVRVLGLAQATATGQPYYPIYELAPYRLMTVGGAAIVAYIWTIFPYPITEASVLRRDLGISLFLLANYLSATTATVDQRLKAREDDQNINTHTGRRLEKMRRKVLGKEVALLESMRKNISFISWEPRLGGDFPKKTYSLLVDEVQNVANFLTIIAYASDSFTSARLSPAAGTWLSQFARSRSSISKESHKITTLLSLLSASIRNGQPLPPYLRTPIDFRLSNELQREGTHILDLENINEPGFRAVAVIEVAQRCLVESLERILAGVRELVGEVDFSWRVEHGDAHGEGGVSTAGSVMSVVNVGIVERGRGH